MMKEVYLPQVHSGFKKFTEEIYNSRTANLTLSIGYRIQGFESSIQKNTLKIASFVQDLYNSTEIFPYQVAD